MTGELVLAMLVFFLILSCLVGFVDYLKYKRELHKIEVLSHSTQKEAIRILLLVSNARYKLAMDAIVELDKSTLTADEKKMLILITSKLDLLNCKELR